MSAYHKRMLKQSIKMEEIKKKELKKLNNEEKNIENETIKDFNKNLNSHFIINNEMCGGNENLCEGLNIMNNNIWKHYAIYDAHIKKLNEKIECLEKQYELFNNKMIVIVNVVEETKNNFNRFLDDLAEEEKAFEEFEKIENIKKK
ncbi:hypothetical protein [Crucivirus-339]|nr:hypothetical protein [Crucivirus-339]